MTASARVSTSEGWRPVAKMDLPAARRDGRAASRVDGARGDAQGA
jgi:hypothetical protein